MQCCLDFVLETQVNALMDGLEASRHILAEYSPCIMMLTAYTDQAYVAQAKELGTCGYVNKPIIRDFLIAELRTAFQKHSQEHSPEDKE